MSEVLDVMYRNPTVISTRPKTQQQLPILRGAGLRPDRRTDPVKVSTAPKTPMSRGSEKAGRNESASNMKISSLGMCKMLLEQFHRAIALAADNQPRGPGEGADSPAMGNERKKYFNKT